MKQHLICIQVLVLLTVAVVAAQAQSFKVTGAVSSSEDKEPLIGATVVEKGTNNGTTTDLDGSFELLVASAQAVLQVSYVGYELREIPLQGRQVITVELTPEYKLMQEVVVTGYKREIRSDVTSAITSVKSRDISKLVVTGIDQALQGQAPGVVVTQVTGAPGDDIAVRIRGVGTLGNNNPLYVIDGIPTTGGLNMFSLTDIESVEVLKDAAAAAVYGSRAANGMVLITTKRGKSGAPVFTFESYAGIQEPVRLPELLNAEEYLLLRNEAITNANSLRNPANQLPTYDPAILDTLPDNGLARYHVQPGAGAAVRAVGKRWQRMGQFLHVG
jgi:TonB-dependent SusC/RagA subfamily outer membrane receptor